MALPASVLTQTIGAPHDRHTVGDDSLLIGYSPARWPVKRSSCSAAMGGLAVRAGIAHDGDQLTTAGACPDVRPPAVDQYAVEAPRDRAARGAWLVGVLLA